MGSDRYLPFLPVIMDWIQRTLDAHAPERRVVSSFNFLRLPQYFSAELLKRARVVVTGKLPRPPLSAFGLREFAYFEDQFISGITYKDTYFLQPNIAVVESVHLHELVHVVQWQVLGPRDFLLLYAAGLAQYGYQDCPLEAMAYGHQRRFEVSELSYSVETEVRQQTLALKPTI